MAGMCHSMSASRSLRNDSTSPAAIASYPCFTRFVFSCSFIRILSTESRPDQRANQAHALCSSAVSETPRVSRRVNAALLSAVLHLPNEFERNGMVRIPLQQSFEHGDALFRAVGSEVNLGQRDVCRLVGRHTLEKLLQQCDRRV